MTAPTAPTHPKAATAMNRILAAALAAATITTALAVSGPAAADDPAGFQPSTTNLRDDTGAEDFILVMPNAPEGAGAATDLRAIRVVTDTDWVRIRYYLASIDYSLGYEFGVTVHNGDRIGQIVSTNLNSVTVRRDVGREGTLCSGSRTGVNRKNVVVTQWIPRWCMPFRHGTLRPYLSTVGGKASSPAAMDSFTVMTPDIWWKK